MQRLFGLVLLMAMLVAPLGAHAGDDIDRFFGLSREQLFSAATDVPEGYERRDVRAGGSGFDFSTIVPRGTALVESEPQGQGGVSAAILVPMKVQISVRHISFNAYADAMAIGQAYMRLSYDQVSNGFAPEGPAATVNNPAFALVAGVRKLDNGRYGRLARAAVISRGDHAIVVLAEFDYADYTDLMPVLSRLFGGIRMQEDMSARAQFRVIRTEDGGKVAIPKRWQVEMLPDQDGGPVGFRLTTNGSGYPEFKVSRLSLGMEEARQHADKLMDEAIASLKASSGVKLTGEGKRLMTPRDAPGLGLYQLSQRWIAVEQDMPMLTVLQILRGGDGRIWQVLEVSPDQSSYTPSGDADMKGRMFHWSATSVSAAAAISQSILRGPEAFIDNHSVRKVGH